MAVVIAVRGSTSTYLAVGYLPVLSGNVGNLTCLWLRNLIVINYPKFSGYGEERAEKLDGDDDDRRQRGMAEQAGRMVDWAIGDAGERRLWEATRTGLNGGGEACEEWVDAECAAWQGDLIWVLHGEDR
ncbi:hypothetical protein M0R45_019334 [Rubus argutus]|uniref:Uncharacterized protein n=1 Tax=Rubus argutus TaxID=59490 RepID=A0AAW1X7L4_RUBAR